MTVKYLGLQTLRVAVTSACVFTASLLCNHFMSCSRTYANGLFELSGGLTSPTGSDLDDSYSIGGQVTVAWGGRPSSMARGSAVYAYTALRREILSQMGPIEYGRPQIERRQWIPSVGVRMYNPFNQKWRFSVDLGLGYAFDESLVRSPATSLIMEDLSFSGESTAFTLGAGLQYKVSPGLLASLGYEHIFFLDKSALGYPERPFINAQSATISGRGRIHLGIGFYL